MRYPARADAPAEHRGTLVRVEQRVLAPPPPAVLDPRDRARRRADPADPMAFRIASVAPDAPASAAAMRVPIDECLPRRRKGDLAGHEVATVPESRWAGAGRRSALRRAASRFDVFVTIDQGLVHQQDLTAALSGSRMSMVVLVARSNRLETLRPLVPALLEALSSLRPGEVRRVGGVQRQAGPG